MRTMSKRTRSFFGRTVLILVVGVISFCAIVVAQRTSFQPQPRADRLGPISGSTRGNAAPATKPDGVLPKVPEGFTVSVYAELRAPRMMVYAPNGDLFVSS